MSFRACKVSKAPMGGSLLPPLVRQPRVKIHIDKRLDSIVKTNLIEKAPVFKKNLPRHFHYPTKDSYLPSEAALSLIQEKHWLTPQEIDLIKKIRIPKLLSGQQATVQSCRRIQVEGENSYLLFDEVEKGDPQIAKPGKSHTPYRAVNLRTGEECILLKINILSDKGDRVSQRKLKLLHNEITMLNLVKDCPSFAKLYSVRVCQITGEAFLIFEFYKEGSIRSYYEKMLQKTVNEFSQDDALQIAYDISVGLDYLHKLRLAHCDIKYPNIALYQEAGRLRAKIIDCEFVTSFGLLKGAGTKKYMPPERFSDGEYHDKTVTPQIDVWGAGYIFHFLSQYVKQEQLHQSFTAVVNAMVHKDPAKRYSMAQVLEWFSQPAMASYFIPR